MRNTTGASVRRSRSLVPGGYSLIVSGVLPAIFIQLLIMFAAKCSVPMSSKYKPGENAIPHFVTFTVVGWVDVFSRELYKEIVVDSLAYCQQHKGLVLHAWIIMPNHVHLIISSQTNMISNLVRDMKKFTSKKIIEAIVNNNKESRKDWMLNMFGYAGRGNSNNKDFQFWKQDYHPIELNDAVKCEQRLHYLHHNPVASGLVWEPWHYKYSSAIDYYTNERGLLNVEHL